MKELKCRVKSAYTVWAQGLSTGGAGRADGTDKRDGP